MYHQEKQIPFRVSASANLTPGIYYINWETEESLQKTLKESQYNPPAKTLIEVAPAEKS